MNTTTIMNRMLAAAAVSGSLALTGCNVAPKTENRATFKIESDAAMTGRESAIAELRRLAGA